MTPLIIAIAVGARLASALYQGSTIDPLPGVTDQLSYHELAVRVVNGHGFSFATGWWPVTRANAPTAHWSYLYVLFLSAIYFVLGASPLAARVIQALIVGVLQPVLACRVGTRLFNREVGLVSAALTAVYGYFGFYAGALVSESLYFVAFLWVIDAATSLGAAGEARFRRLGPWLSLGAALAAAALLRQVFLLMVPLVLAWVAWRAYRGQPDRGGLRGRPLLGRLAATSLVLVLAIAPWTIRNYRAFGTFVLLNTNAGFAFYWGNHPVHKASFIPIIPNSADVNYLTLLPRDLRRLNEAEFDRALLLRGLGFVRDDPVRYVLLSASRAIEYFKFWPSRDSSFASNIVRVFSFGLFLPLFLLGLIAALRSRGKNDAARRMDSPGVLLILLLSGAYTIVHLLTWTLVRYRLPLDATAMPVAAAGAVYAWRYVKTVVVSNGMAESLPRSGADVSPRATRGAGGAVTTARH